MNIYIRAASRAAGTRRLLRRMEPALSSRISSLSGYTRRLSTTSPSSVPSSTSSPSSSSSSDIVPTSTTEDNHHLLPAQQLIDFSASVKIEGEESQVAMVTLRPGETLRAESGAMLFMTQGVEMATDLHGMSSAFSRMMTGQNVFLTDYTYTGTSGEGMVGLGTDFPSKIVRLSLQDYENSSLICQRGAYMASNPTVNIEMEATKSLSAGFFGGQGFILQRLTGQGDVLVKAGGTLVTKDLQEGEILRVTSGSIVAFTTSVQYDIQMMPGIKNAMFGGEGLFVTTLTGPGRVWLQGMPADRMIAEIARRVPSGGPGIGIPIGVGGGGGGGDSAGGANEAAGDAAAGGAMAGTGAGTGEAATTQAPEEMVAATDQAIQADRNATVASSGMMGSEPESDSPSALFGDAAPTEPSPSIGTETIQQDPFNETTFSDDAATFPKDETSFSDSTSETVFSDDDTFSQGDFDQSSQDSESFWSEGSQSVSDAVDSGATEEASSAVSNVLRTLWDLFNGDD